MSRTYCSCIKIAGVPILPPLVTPKVRAKCKEYREKAVQVEGRLERNRLFKKCVQDIEALELQTKNIPSQSIESQLAFDAKSPSHVPYKTYNKLKNLQRETIDVTEYSGDGVRILSATPPPKLIRSNSYVLESPSPVLLAHLEKEAQGHVEEERPGRESKSTMSVSSQSLYFSFTSPELPAEDLRVVDLRRSKVFAREERAASVIGAAVKGYLVRRLLRTAKVQNLIETIKDALLCAIDLHKADVIQESDVELHRRLIQQVSAACFAFHEVFFSLSTKEQMLIIASDRQKRKEKERRLSTASSRNSGN